MPDHANWALLDLDRQGCPPLPPVGAFGLRDVDVEVVTREHQQDVCRPHCAYDSRDVIRRLVREYKEMSGDAALE